MDFLDELETRVLCGDGAIGTMLLNAGVPVDRCLEELCVSQPERIREIHRRYIAAGARVIETNSFGANAVRLERFGMEERVAEINRAAATIAREAIGNQPIYLAGSVGPLGLTADEARRRRIDRAQCFEEQTTALAESGADLIFLETFTSCEELEIAFCAKEKVSKAPALCSFACAPTAALGDGTSLVEAFAKLESIGAKLFGVNCMNDPVATCELVRRLPPRYRMAAYATAGFPIRHNEQLMYPVRSDEFGRGAQELIAEGVRLVGGCCGTTPAHIAAVASAVARCE
ncbi:MAG TPA: homocysteine S-methyltransferase family protein [Chthoniobacterales bacterium]|nr:homocysteine S-methyltransferase family protein [Chthoniobacterales bacterium]